jgi:hypothetical protein
MLPYLFRTYEFNLRNLTCLTEKKMQLLTLGGQYLMLRRGNPVQEGDFLLIVSCRPFMSHESPAHPAVLIVFQDQSIIVCIPMFILSICCQNTVLIFLSRWYILVPCFFVI